MNTVAHGFKWNSIGAFGYLGLHALSIVLLARLAGAEAVGVYLLAQAVGVPLSRLAGLRYHDINATEERISRLGEHYRNVTLVSLPLFACALALWWYLNSGTTREAGIFIILANACLAYAQVSQGRLVRLSQFRLAAFIEIARGLVSVLAFAAGLLLYDSFLTAAMLLASGWFCILGVEITLVFRISRAAHRCPPQRISLLSRARYALSDSASILQLSAVRVLLGHLVGELAVGVFGATALLIRLMQPAAVAFSRSLMPQLAEGLERGELGIVEQQINRIHRATALLIALFTAAGFLLTPTLVDLLMGESLRPSPTLAAIIMFGAAPLVGSRFLVQILIALRDREGVEQVSWIGLIGTLIVAPPLISLWGLTGAAVAASAGYCLRYGLCIRRLFSAVRTARKSGSGSPVTAYPCTTSE